MANAFIQKKVTYGFAYAVIICLVVFAAILRYRSGEIDYRNSDATWHTLLTIKCYDETSVSEHLFLPIVSLGGENDKNIPWGATIPDKNGNYYYTSFSPAGFFAAWIFIKLLRLPVSEGSLYIFNNVLLAISAVLFMRLLYLIYEKNRYKELLCFLGGMVYIWCPEILHGLGIVYWSQSVMQVTLLLQISFYYGYAIKGRRRDKLPFYIMALANPYIEWTGYVANVGFAIAEMLLNWKSDRKKAWGKAVALGVITGVSFGLFCIHYLLRVDPGSFFDALKSRFMTRNITTTTLLTDVFGGYLKSFLYLWILLFIILIWSFIIKGSLNLRDGILFLIIIFPVLENVIMKEHALTYTYDRMKAVWGVIFLFCEAARNILEVRPGKKNTILLIILTMLFSTWNLSSYVKNESYIWNVDYRKNNERLAEYVTARYPDNALYASDTEIRGYMNLLFGRGIYEGISVDSAKEIAKEKGNESVVFIVKDDYRILTVTAYAVSSDAYIQYAIENGEIVEENEGKEQT